MPLLNRLAFPETVGDMLQASYARFEEGMALMDAGHFDGGIYLLGYVAEMILKIAFCRMDTMVPPTITVRSKFPDAVQLWRSLFATPPPNGYEHNLIFWETVLPLERAAKHKPVLGVIVAQTLSQCIKVVDDNWDVKMRYQPRTATGAEADEVRIAVQWLYSNQTTLWR